MPHGSKVIEETSNSTGPN